MPKVKPLTPITDYSRLGRENLKTARKDTTAGGRPIKYKFKVLSKN